MEHQLTKLSESITFKREESVRAKQSGTIDLKYGPAKFINPNTVEVVGMFT